MNIIPGSGPNRCVHCMRKKTEAIKEHVKTMKNCDNPQCPFSKDIEEAIEAEKKKKPPFTIGQKTPPKFRFNKNNG